VIFLRIVYAVHPVFISRADPLHEFHHQLLLQTCTRTADPSRLLFQPFFTLLFKDKKGAACFSGIRRWLFIAEIRVQSWVT
jgi:hypothetical protein